MFIYQELSDNYSPRIVGAVATQAGIYSCQLSSNLNNSKLQKDKKNIFKKRGAFVYQVLLQEQMTYVNVVGGHVFRAASNALCCLKD